MAKHKRRYRKAIRQCFAAFISLFIVAQSVQAESISSFAIDDKTLYFTLLTIAGVLTAIALLLGLIALVVLDKVINPEPGKSMFPIIQEDSFTRVWEKFVGLRSAEKTTIATGASAMADHEYDQIRELDNPPPPIFNYIFYGTIGFALIYMVYYHVLDGPLMEEEYRNEMQLAALQRKQMQGLVDENTVKLLSESSELGAGKDIYIQNCASCHGQAGEGLVGPNLTDVYWLHGGSINEVFKTIKYGVPEKGMIAWQSQLSPAQIAQVASYILTLQGSNPPNAKAPEGDLFNGAKPVPQDSIPEANAKPSEDI